MVQEQYPLASYCHPNSMEHDMNPWFTYLIVAIFTIAAFAVLETIAFSAPWMYTTTFIIMMVCNFFVQLVCIVNIMHKA